MGQIVRDHALVLGTEKVQPTELRKFLERWGGISFLHTSLLLHEPRSPVDNTELSEDCLHNHYYRKLDGVDNQWLSTCGSVVLPINSPAVTHKIATSHTGKSL